MSHIFTGDTIRVVGTFRDYAPEGDLGDPIDPDDNDVTITIYDSSQSIVSTGTGTRSDVGEFYYEWTAPLESGTYYVEFKAEVAGYPQLSRTKYRVRFKPDA